MTATPVSQLSTGVHVGPDLDSIDDLSEARARLLEEAQAFLSSPEVSASGYVKGIAIEHAHDALNDVARIDATIARLAAPAEAEGDQK